MRLIKEMFQIRPGAEFWLIQRREGEDYTLLLTSPPSYHDLRTAKTVITFKVVERMEIESCEKEE